MSAVRKPASVTRLRTVATQPPPPRARMSDVELADYFGGSPSVATLRKWRHYGRGPAYLKIGRSVVYRLEDVQAWEEQHVIRHDT